MIKIRIHSVLSNFFIEFGAFPDIRILFIQIQIETT